MLIRTLAPIAAFGLVGAFVFSETLGRDGVGTSAGEGFFSRLVGNISMVASDEPVLMGRRQFTADLQLGALRLDGMAYTFENQSNPETFVPYFFSFNGTSFGPLGRMAADDVTQQYIRFDGPTLPTSLPPPENCSTSEAGEPLCVLRSSVPDQRPALIGAIPTDQSALPLASGDDACRARIENWLSMPAYADISVVICVVQDLPHTADAYASADWMDVIFYQKHGTRLLNMRAERRNFQHI